MSTDEWMNMGIYTKHRAMDRVNIIEIFYIRV
jgi:hypothetical protein